MFVYVKKILVAWLITSCIACNSAFATISAPPLPQLPQLMPSNWESLYLSGVHAFEKQHYAEAERSLKSALSSAGTDTSKKVLTLGVLDELYEEQQNYPAEANVLLQSVEAMRSSDQASDPLMGVIYMKLASVSSSMNHFDKAEQYELTALPILKESEGPASADVAVALNNLAWIEYKLRKYSQSEKYFRQSLYLLNKNFGDKHVLYGLTANNLADLYELMGKKDKAYLWYQKAGAAFKAALGEKDTISQEAERHCRKLKPFARKK